MEKLRTCFFTGHRKIANNKLEILKEKISKHIETLIVEYDVKNFISGGALGFDTLAAQIVIELREKYPHIKLLMYLPCYGQSRKWTSDCQYYYRLILSKADEIKFVTEEEYTEQCMKLRNLEMIKDSFFCIAFCLVSSSGTGFTIRNAEAVGLKIINIADEIYN